MKSRDLGLHEPCLTAADIPYERLVWDPGSTPTLFNGVLGLPLTWT